MPMDRIMWRQLGGVLTRHYPFTREEVVLPGTTETLYPPSDRYDPYMFYRNHGRVVIDPERLLEIVQGVVKWIRRDAGRLARTSLTGGG